MKYILLLLIGYLRFSEAIFEDQVGKFDWRKQLIGSPNEVYFDRTERGSDKLLVSSRDEIIASLSLNTGEIVWRRILEKQNSTSSASVVTSADEENLYSLVDGGRLLRAWRKIDGTLAWQKPVSDVNSKTAAIATFDKSVVVAVDSKLIEFTNIGDQKFTANLAKKSVWSHFVVSGSQAWHVAFDGAQLIVRKITSTGANAAQTVDFAKFNSEKCTVSGSSVVCAHSDALYFVDLQKTPLAVVEKNVGVAVREISGSPSGLTAVRSQTSVKIFDGANLAGEVSRGFDAVTVAEGTVIAASKTSVAAYRKNGEAVFEINLPTDASRVETRRVFASRANNDWELLLVGEDSRLELVAVEPKKATALIEWTREESLIRVASVELVDLPLSESQQMIEDEFEGSASGNLVAAFVHRVVTQIGQLRKWIARTIQQVFLFSSTLSARTGSFSDIINAVKSASSSDAGSAFERDLFNLRKVILVTTFDGVVFAIDSHNGVILWKIFLANNFSPLSSQFGEVQVPLFVQRTTAHYQLHGQAAVVFKDSVTSNGVIVLFNPMTGEIIEKKLLAQPIKKVSFLPFVNKDHIHSLIVFDKSGQVSYVPDVHEDVLKAAAPLYILNVDKEGKSVSGQKVNLAKREVTTAWSGNLGLQPTDKIIAVKGKPYNQKVHSQGRVLIDRNVQYKFVNPNLAAVGAVDETHQSITLTLFDVVSGQVVHTASVSKASAPLHFVHSENWLAYSYWSEKGRRTELGIVELYEGSEEQSMAETFDSMSPTKVAPVALAQSYIYAQGIEAMSVTETEQGLTTRSILIAHPGGGIHEVSRRLLDATRPLELTQEMREEMMIGYVPEIAVSTEEMINYNQTVHRVAGIKTSPAGLESTSLVFAYGTDIFFTRLAPSGTFDILKDDFDHVLISLVLAGLVIGTIVSKRLAKSNALNAQWA